MINPVHIHGGQCACVGESCYCSGGRSARDNNFMLRCTLCLAQFSKDVVGFLFIHPGLHILFELLYHIV